MVTGFVLTGGRSSRMGRDKAMLRLASGETLLERALGLMASVAAEVRLVGARERYAALAWSGEIVEDIYKDRGPLGGIHAGLKGSETELNVFMAVDMPAMTGELLKYLVERAKSSTALVTVPEIGGQQQPLCAVYRKEFYKNAELALEQERNKVNGAFPADQTLVVLENEIVSAGFGAELFRNLNTAEEWEEYRG